MVDYRGSKHLIQRKLDSTGSARSSAIPGKRYSLQYPNSLPNRGEANEFLRFRFLSCWRNVIAPSITCFANDSARLTLASVDHDFGSLAPFHSAECIFVDRLFSKAKKTVLLFAWMITKANFAHKDISSYGFCSLNEFVESTDHRAINPNEIRRVWFIESTLFVAANFVFRFNLRVELAKKRVSNRFSITNKRAPKFSLQQNH